MNNSISKQFFVQPNNEYHLTITDSKILIESIDDINKIIDLVDAKIKTYYDQIFEI